MLSRSLAWRPLDILRSLGVRLAVAMPAPRCEGLWSLSPGSTESMTSLGLLNGVAILPGKTLAVNEKKTGEGVIGLL